MAVALAHQASGLLPFRFSALWPQRLVIFCASFLCISPRHSSIFRVSLPLTSGRYPIIVSSRTHSDSRSLSGFSTRRVVCVFGPPDMPRPIVSRLAAVARSFHRDSVTNYLGLGQRLIRAMPISSILWPYAFFPSACVPSRHRKRANLSAPAFLMNLPARSAQAPARRVCWSPMRLVTFSALGVADCARALAPADAFAPSRPRAPALLMECRSCLRARCPVKISAVACRRF